MSARITTRTWATPLTIGSFILMSGTGVFMFFEQQLGLMIVVHQWFSWFFLLGAVSHIATNFKPFNAHLKSTWGRYLTGVSLSVLVASAFDWGQITGPQLERPVEQALVDAPISALAEVTRQSLSDLQAKFLEQGVKIEAGQSVSDLARVGRMDENRALGLIFGVN